MKVRALLAVLFLTAFSFVHPAFSQLEHVDMTKIPEIASFLKELPEQKFLEDSELIEDTPLGDKYLAFRLRLPKKWTRATIGEKVTWDASQTDGSNIGQRIMVQISQYFGPTRLDALSRFEVSAQTLQHEVTAKNWFMHEILARGYALEGLNVYSDRKVEALYVMVERGTAYVVRAIAEINGPRVVLASYWVPDKYWAEERAQQEHAIKSFEFVSPHMTKIELTKSYAFLDLLSFEYPASWRLIAPNIWSIEGMEAKVVSSVDDKMLNGEISIVIVTNEDESYLNDEIAFIKKDMESRNLQFNKRIEVLNDKYKLGPHVLYSYFEAYKLQKDGTIDHEFWLGIMEESRYYYVVSMITPGRSKEFYSWARNVEAFQTVVESLKP